MIALLFAIIAGTTKAVQDLCSEQAFFNSKLDKFGFKFDWWHRGYSSHRKWKNGFKADGERFFGSSTFLVWTTDGWHLMDAIRNVSLIIVGFTSGSWIMAGISLIVYLTVFEILYSYLKR